MCGVVRQDCRHDQRSGGQPDGGFYNAGEAIEIYRARSFGGRDIYFSDDDGVTWKFLGRVDATGRKTFIIRFGTPLTGYYRFDPAP